jgi:hypothetical protein
MKVICWGAKNWKTQKLQGGTPIIARSNDVERAASDICEFSPPNNFESLGFKV